MKLLTRLRELRNLELDSNYTTYIQPVDDDAIQLHERLSEFSYPLLDREYMGVGTVTETDMMRITAE